MEVWGLVLGVLGLVWGGVGRCGMGRGGGLGFGVGVEGWCGEGRGGGGGGVVG